MIVFMSTFSGSFYVSSRTLESIELDWHLLISEIILNKFIIYKKEYSMLEIIRRGVIKKEIILELLIASNFNKMRLKELITLLARDVKP